MTKFIKFKEFGYYQGNRSDEEAVEVDDNFADYVLGMKNAVEVEAPPPETPPEEESEEPNFSKGVPKEQLRKGMKK